MKHLTNDEILALVCEPGDRPAVRSTIADQPTAVSSSQEELRAEVERLREENERLRARTGARMKVSARGAVSVYGLGRFPVTLYRDQWLRLLNMADEIRAFIKANADKLARKPE